MSGHRDPAQPARFATALLLRKIGSWAFIVVGCGHLAAQLAAPESAQCTEILNTMRQFVIDMPGRAGTLYEYHTGFSLMMGLLLTAYGLRTLFSLRQDTAEPRRGLPQLAIDIAISAIAVGISATFFFAVPLLLTTLALLAFSLAFVITLKTVGLAGS